MQVGCFVVMGALSTAGLFGCGEESHSAQWYMAHSAEHQAKLIECKTYPALNASDQNCKNANEAWATLVTATAKPK